MKNRKISNKVGLTVSRSDLTGLRVFEAVARNRGFSAAQSELGLSQPSISNHLSALETRLGVRLCQRGATGFEITEKGQTVLDAAQRLFAAMDAFSADVDDLRDRIVGKIRIGVVDAIASDPSLGLPKTIAAFKEIAPDVVIQISEDTPQVLQERVRSGELHVGLGSFPTRAKDLEHRPLHIEHHSLYCAEGHVLFDVDVADICEDHVRTLPVVSRGYWREEMLDSYGLSNVMAVSYQIEPQLLLILSGHYTGFLPDHFASGWTRSGKLKAILPDVFSYTCGFDLIYRKSAQKSRILRTFLNAAIPKDTEN